MRYNNTYQTTYIISNEIILFLKIGEITKQKNLNDIQEVTYENGRNDTRYIILGKAAPLFAGRGLSLKEVQYILNNLTNFKEVAAVLKKLIAR